MASSPRPIFFSTELESPPIKELAISREVVRRLYNKMFEPGGYRYENLTFQAAKPVMWTQRSEDAASRCEIGQYMVRLEESKPEVPVDSFIEMASTVLTGLEQISLGLKKPCPPFFVQRTKIQCLAQTRLAPIDLLADRIAKVKDRITPFGRPPSFFGVRFRFVPWDPSYEEQEESEDPSVITQDAVPEPQAEQAENEVNLPETPAGSEMEGEENVLQPATDFATVRFEPYSRDRSQIWIEVASTHFAEGGPLTLDDLAMITKNIKGTTAIPGTRFADGL